MSIPIRTIRIPQYSVFCQECAQATPLSKDKAAAEVLALEAGFTYARWTNGVNIQTKTLCADCTKRWNRSWFVSEWFFGKRGSGEERD